MTFANLSRHLAPCYFGYSPTNKLVLISLNSENRGGISLDKLILH